MDLQKVWSTEIEILDQIDKFCRSHNLKYSIAYGTLLGAVRHGGFIPWDDDIDIVMPRKDYEYLLAYWDVPGYILQNKRTNDDYNQNFTKIRKDHTTFIQFEFEKNVSYHTGVFVDIFPCDRVAPEGLMRKLQFFYCAINLLYSREGVTSKKETLPEKILMSIPRTIRLKILQLSEKKIQSWNTGTGQFFIPITIKEAQIYYSPQLFNEMIEIGFCEKKYMSVKSYDEFLRGYYGDYMKLPPEEERVYRHHPLVVNFEKNYTEIAE